MQDIAGGVRTNSPVTLSYGPHHMDEQVLIDQLELSTTVLYEHMI